MELGFCRVVKSSGGGRVGTSNMPPSIGPRQAAYPGGATAPPRANQRARGNTTAGHSPSHFPRPFFTPAKLARPEGRERRPPPAAYLLIMAPGDPGHVQDDMQGLVSSPWCGGCGRCARARVCGYVFRVPGLSPQTPDTLTWSPSSETFPRAHTNALTHTRARARVRAVPTWSISADA